MESHDTWRMLGFSILDILQHDLEDDHRCGNPCNAGCTNLEVTDGQSSEESTDCHLLTRIIVSMPTHLSDAADSHSVLIPSACRLVFSLKTPSLISSGRSGIVEIRSDMASVSKLNNIPTEGASVLSDVGLGGIVLVNRSSGITYRAMSFHTHGRCASPTEVTPSSRLRSYV